MGATAVADAPAMVQPAQGVRPRENGRVGGEVEAQLLPLLRELLSSGGQGPTVKPTLSSLVELTAWRAPNQAALVHGRVVPVLLRLAEQVYSGREEATANAQLALWLLSNLSANDALCTDIAGTPGCLEVLARLLACQTPAITVLATRCLISLTDNSVSARSSLQQVRVCGCALANCWFKPIISHP